MPTNAHKRHKVGTGGPWGTGLLLLGIAITIQGTSYVTVNPARLSPALEWMDQAIPVATWGGIWVAAGIYSICMALTPPQQHMELAAAIGVICLWSAIHGIYWLMTGLLQGEWTRTWTAAVAWGALAAVLMSFGRCINPPSRHDLKR
jgi:hypothetical protein